MVIFGNLNFRRFRHCHKVAASCRIYCRNLCFLWEYLWLPAQPGDRRKMGKKFGGCIVPAKSTICRASHENWRKPILCWMNAENMIGRCPEMWQWMCVPDWSDLLENLWRLFPWVCLFLFHKWKIGQESSFGHTEWRRFNNWNHISSNEFVSADFVRTYPTVRWRYSTSRGLLMNPGSIFCFLDKSLF